MKTSQVGYARECVRVLGPEGFLVTCERSPIKRLGRGIVSFGVEQPPQVIYARECIRVLGPQKIFMDGKYALSKINSLNRA